MFGFDPKKAVLGGNSMAALKASKYRIAGRQMQIIRHASANDGETATVATQRATVAVSPALALAWPMICICRPALRYLHALSAAILFPPSTAVLGSMPNT